MSKHIQIKLTAPITHDKVNYPVGEILSLPLHQAERLVFLGCGVILEKSMLPLQAAEMNVSTKKEETVKPEVSLSREENHAQEEGSLINLVMEKIEPKDMTVEELEAELTAAGIEIREGMSEKALMARVIKLRKDEA